MRKSHSLDTGPIANFDFIKILNEDRTYRLLFPVREVGMAILEIYEAIGNNLFEDKKFTEADLHLAFSKAHGVGERYPKEVYSAHIMDLQEYFLDYDQPSQKYFFKDYAFKFCEHAKATLIGAFNPTRIQNICSHLSKSLQAKETEEGLIFWLKEEFVKFEPDMREQVDFLDRQIANSIEQLKQRTLISQDNFIAVLIATDENLTLSQTHVKELRAAYSETKIIREVLNRKHTGIEETGLLIRDVNLFFRYCNDRLNSIDRKLDRIQPKVKQLFTSLNKPIFNAKVERFISHLLDNSVVEYGDTQKFMSLPAGVENPVLRYKAPSFTILSPDKELFPAKPNERKQYVQNKEAVRANTEKTLKVIKDADVARKWEDYILSEIQLKGRINLSEAFFTVAADTDPSLAVTVLFNTIRRVYKTPSLKLNTVKKLYTNLDYKDITLWKMEVIKIQ